MTRIAEYPKGGIRDVIAWRTEVGLVAYRDGQLTFRQLAEYIDEGIPETLKLLRVHGISIEYDADSLAEDLAAGGYTAKPAG